MALDNIIYRNKGEDFRRFEVDAVERGSPAESAGLKKGDILTAMNRHQARELDLEKIDEMLQETGRAIPMTIQRDGRTLEIVLKLRERI